MTALEIENLSHPEPNSGCWLWLGAMSGTRARLRNENAARVAYRAYKAEIPAGLLVRHKCDNPMCVNPGHLEVGTYADNVADAFRRKRAAFVKDRSAGLARLVLARAAIKTPSHGSARWSAKLSEGDIPRIRARLSAGQTQKAVAAEFGVNQSVISGIATGKRWRHV